MSTTSSRSSVWFAVVAHSGYWLLYLLLLATVFGLLGAVAGSPPRLADLLFSRLSWIALAPNLLAFYGGYWTLFPDQSSPRFGVLVAGGAAVALGSVLVALAPVYLFFPGRALLARGARARRIGRRPDGDRLHPPSRVAGAARFSLLAPRAAPRRGARPAGARDRARSAALATGPPLPVQYAQQHRRPDQQPAGGGVALPPRALGAPALRALRILRRGDPSPGGARLSRPLRGARAHPLVESGLRGPVGARATRSPTRSGRWCWRRLSRTPSSTATANGWPERSASRSRSATGASGSSA